MLAERKKYNYIATKASGPRASLGGDENGRIEELEKANYRIVEETTKQFKKLQSDVQRVECILQEKEAIIAEWKASHARVVQEKNILIEALYEKDIIIHQFQAKLQQYLRETHPTHIITNTCITQIHRSTTIDTQTQIEDTQTQIEDTQTQIEDTQTEGNKRQTEKTQKWKQTEGCNLMTFGCFEMTGRRDGESQTTEDEKYKELFKRAMTLEDEVYRLRQQLYDAKSQLALTEHQFQTHKILTEMERVK